MSERLTDEALQFAYERCASDDIMGYNFVTLSPRALAVALAELRALRLSPDDVAALATIRDWLVHEAERALEAGVRVDATRALQVLSRLIEGGKP